MKQLIHILLFIIITFGFFCSQKDNKSISDSPQAGSVIKDALYNIEMVYIPAGTFIMGSDTGGEDENPAHEVSLDAFYIGKFKITQKEWTAVMGNNPSEFKGENHPVENVSWDDAQLFAKKLSETTGQKYRLPTEAEWEYACRAGTKTVYYFGNDTLKLGEYAWTGKNSGGKTHPVGLKKPNDWGLYDMAGNLREWVEDWWDPEYYQRSEYKNPVNHKKYLYKNPRTKKEYGLCTTRGGNWRSPYVNGSESAHRHANAPEEKYNYTGFRLVREK